MSDDVEREVRERMLDSLSQEMFEAKCAAKLAEQKYQTLRGEFLATLTTAYGEGPATYFNKSANRVFERIVVPKRKFNAQKFMDEYPHYQALIKEETQTTYSLDEEAFAVAAIEQPEVMTAVSSCIDVFEPQVRVIDRLPNDVDLIREEVHV